VAYFFSLPAPCLPLSLDRVYLLRGNIVFNTNFLFIWINIEVCLQCVILCLVYLHHIDKVTILILCVLSIVADSLNDTWVKDRHDFFNLLFIRNYITTKIFFFANLVECCIIFCHSFEANIYKSITVLLCLGQDYAF
jgi:hypothetical protein